MINQNLNINVNKLKSLTKDFLYKNYFNARELVQKFYHDLTIKINSYIIGRSDNSDNNVKLLISCISIVILTLVGLVLLSNTSGSIYAILTNHNTQLNTINDYNLINNELIENKYQHASKDIPANKLAVTMALPQIDIPQFSCFENTIFVSHEETPIFSGPDADLPYIQDKQGNTKFLDPRENLKILNQINDWIEVSVISPNWPPTLNNITGWIHKISLQKDMPDKNYKCIYIDFSKWRGIEINTRNLIKDNATRLLKIDRRCRRIVQGGLQLSNQRYYLTCSPADGGKPYHYWFSFQKSEEFIAPPKIPSEEEALQSCDMTLQKTLKNNFLIDHQNIVSDETIAPEVRILGSSFQTTAYGWQVKITYTFNASNEANSYCFYGPSKKAEIFL